MLVDQHEAYRRVAPNQHSHKKRNRKISAMKSINFIKKNKIVKIAWNLKDEKEKPRETEEKEEWKEEATVNEESERERE